MVNYYAQIDLVAIFPRESYYMLKNSLFSDKIFVTPQCIFIYSPAYIFRRRKRTDTIWINELLAIRHGGADLWSARRRAFTAGVCILNFYFLSIFYFFSKTP